MMNALFILLLEEKHKKLNEKCVLFQTNAEKRINQIQEQVQT